MMDSGAAVIWNVASGKPQRIFRDIRAGSEAAISSDGTQLVAEPDYSTFAIWSIETGEQTYTLPSGSALVDDFAFSPDGYDFAASYLNGVVEVWKPYIYKDKPDKTFTGHSDRATSVAYLPLSEALVSGSADMTLRR